MKQDSQLTPGALIFEQEKIAYGDINFLKTLAPDQIQNLIEQIKHLVVDQPGIVHAISGGLLHQTNVPTTHGLGITKIYEI